MAKGIDAVVVSDHQSGQWIDKLKSVYSALETVKPQGFRPLVIFPGVELAVSDGVHVLFILDPSRTSSDITRLLGLAKYKGKDGDPNGRAESSLLDLLKELRSPDQMDCLAIPAHVNGASGLFHEKESKPTDTAGDKMTIIVKQDAATRSKILAHDELIAVEVLPKTDMSKVDKELAGVLGKQIARVYGSDSHSLAAVGSRSTWVKMESADLAGLRLALLDGEDAVRRFDPSVDLPENNRPFFVRRLVVENGSIIGRKGDKLPTFELNFSPSLNTIIGGRSAGKSSVVELIRQASMRANELGNESPLRENFEGLISFLDTGDSNAPLRAWLEYQLHGQDFVLDWRRIGGRDEWALWERGASGQFQKSQQPLEASRFPIRIFSQKQIYSFAKRANDLLAQIDAHPEVNVAKEVGEIAVLEKSYLQRLAERQFLSVALAEKPKYEAAQQDLVRQIEALQKSGHEAILRETQLRRRQHGEIERWSDSWRELPAHIEGLAQRMEISDLSLTANGESVAAAEQEVLALARAANAKLAQLSAAVRSIAGEVTTAATNWNQSLAGSQWQASAQQAEAAYQKLLTDLKTGGVQGPEQFGKLLQERQLVERKLAEFAQTAKQLADVDSDLPKLWQQIRDKRIAISETREKFIQSVFGARQEFRVSLRRFSTPESSRKQLRQILKRDDEKLAKDFETFIDYLFSKDEKQVSSQDFENRLQALKTTLYARSQGQSGTAPIDLTQWFINHLKTINTEDWGRLWLWFPDDGLDLEYRGADGKMVPVQSSSPGQASAAILAFLLSFGDEPLIFDQPEDDLDNRLIYDLIVRQLRENKKRRQIIIVTHNANIVVNGNSELIFAIEPHNGQSQITARGSLQKPKVREAICGIMEGGEEAFKRRFRRILEKD